MDYMYQVLLPEVAAELNCGVCFTQFLDTASFHQHYRQAANYLMEGIVIDFFVRELLALLVSMIELTSDPEPINSKVHLKNRGHIIKIFTIDGTKNCVR